MHPKPAEGAEHETRTTVRGPAWGKLILIAAVIAGLAAAWRYTPLSEWITPERITGWARATREVRWAPLLVILAYTPAAFVMFPRPLITLFTVVAFGPWLGFTYAILGVMSAALVTYYVGRVLPERTVHRLAGKKLTRLQERLRAHGFIAVLVLRILPTAPFAVESMVAGAFRIRVLDYIAGSFVGLAPGVLASSAFGSQITNALDDLSRVNYWLVGAAALLMAGLTYGASRWVAAQARARSGE